MKKVAKKFEKMLKKVLTISEFCVIIVKSPDESSRHRTLKTIQKRNNAIRKTVIPNE